MAERLVLWHRRVPAVRDEQEDAEACARWSREVVSALARARAEVVCIAGGSVAALLDIIDHVEAIDAMLALMAEAERREPALKVSFGVALGDVATHRLEGVAVTVEGAVVDRAQLLANRARAGEIVLDPQAYELAQVTYLFGRQVGAGAGALKGYSLDRAHPRRRDCRPSIEHLGLPIVPNDVAEALARVEELVQLGGQHRVILRGPLGSGSREYIEALARDYAPPLLLRLEAVPAGLEPLGSLRYALTRRWKTREGVEAAVAPLPRSAPETLAKVARGAPVHRKDAVDALRALLESQGERAQRPWVFANPLGSVNPATVGVLADAFGDGGPDVLFIGRLPMDAKVPKPLQKRGVEEIILPPLRTADAREITDAILGPNTSEEVSRRVAVLGGDSPLGVLEAARTLIASGDLVWEGDRFRWRVGARGGVNGIPVDALLEERLASVEATPRRVLEAVCAAPSGAPSDLARSVAMADGIDTEALADAIDQLCIEALLAPEEPLYATSSVLRAVIVQAMPPSRVSEMYRFIAGAMEAAASHDAAFEKATVGYYLAEGGQEAEGALALLEAGRAAAKNGFLRAAVRLAAAAVQYHPTPATRAAAAELSRSVTSQSMGAEDRTAKVPMSLPAPDKPGATLGQSAVTALLARDFEAVDRLLDIAMAEGHDQIAIDRFRSIAHLARGDVSAAVEALARVRRHGETPSATALAKDELARGIVSVATGRVVDGVRAALRALKTSRESSDPQGEAAALSALALCYRAIGREDEAARFDEASPA